MDYFPLATLISCTDGPPPPLLRRGAFRHLPLPKGELVIIHTSCFR
jgi:hypothetical protein